MGITNLRALSFALVLCFAAMSSAAAAEFDRASVERDVMQVIDAYMSAWNKQDLAAWEGTFHFPHYRLASGRMSVLEQAGQQDAKRIWASIDGWHRSAWDRVKLVHVSADKVHVDTQFTRYRIDGSKIGTYDSLYIVTREDERWGVKLRSSFAQ